MCLTPEEKMKLFEDLAVIKDQCKGIPTIKKDVEKNKVFRLVVTSLCVVCLTIFGAYYQYQILENKREQLRTKVLK